MVLPSRHLLKIVILDVKLPGSRHNFLIGGRLTYIYSKALSIDRNTKVADKQRQLSVILTFHTININAPSWAIANAIYDAFKIYIVKSGLHLDFYGGFVRAIPDVVWMQWPWMNCLSVVVELTKSTPPSPSTLHY